MNSSDEKIMLMQEKIVEKRNLIKKAKKFSPLTHCSLVLNGNRYNIHAVDKDTCVHLLVSMNALLRSAKDLMLEDAYKIEGYPISYWVNDLEARLNYLTVRQQESELQMLEKRLNELLSNEKKVELELSEIEKLLE